MFPQRHARPIAFGVLTCLVFFSSLAALSVDTLSISSGTRRTRFRVLDGNLEMANCDGFPDVFQTPRTFLILALLGVLPCAVLVTLDALKQTAALGPATAHFQFVMAGAAGYMAFCLIVAWSIMMAIPSKVRLCVFPVPDVKIEAAPFFALAAWLMACAMIAVAIFVPVLEKDAPPLASAGSLHHTVVEVPAGSCARNSRVAGLSPIPLGTAAVRR